MEHPHSSISKFHFWVLSNVKGGMEEEGGRCGGGGEAKSVEWRRTVDEEEWVVRRSRWSAEECWKMTNQNQSQIQFEKYSKFELFIEPSIEGTN